jgi:hypothetical protein
LDVISRDFYQHRDVLSGALHDFLFDNYSTRHYENDNPKKKLDIPLFSPVVAWTIAYAVQNPNNHQVLST